MKKFIIAAAAFIALIGQAHAGTQLQLQFRQWSWEGSGLVKLLVTLRNPTAKPFATVVWDCDFFDEQHRLVGRQPLVFHKVLWGGIVVDTQYVASNGMFQSGTCQLAYVEEVTAENELLYRGSPNQLNLGENDPNARNYFTLPGRELQGRQQVISKEDEETLEKNIPTDVPGYRNVDRRYGRQ